MNKTKKESNINIRLKKSDKDFLETLAHLNDISISLLVRQILQEQIAYIKGMDKMTKDMEVKDGENISTIM